MSSSGTETTGKAKPSCVRYQVMAFLLALSFLTYFDRVCIVRVQQEIQFELKLDDDQMAYVFGAFWLAYALFEIPGGWLGDRFGARITLTRVVFFWSLFTLFTGLATGFLSLLIIRFLFGIGEAGAFPNMARVQANWFPVTMRGRAGGWLWLAARWGGAFSPFLFAGLLVAIESPGMQAVLAKIPVLSELSSWRIGFIVAGVVGFIWCLWFYLWFRDYPAEKQTVNQAELFLIRGSRQPPLPVKSHAVSRHLWKDLLKNRSLRAIAFFYIFGSFGWSFFVSWMPRYLKDVHHYSFDVSDSIWKQPLLYGGISCLLGGTLSDWMALHIRNKWLSRALFPVFGLTTAAIAIFCVGYVESAEDAVILMCIAGAAFDFGQGATWASIVDIGGHYAGTAAGFINMLGNLGNAIQPIIGSWIFNTFGWNPLFTVYAAAFVIAASAWFWIDPSKPFHSESRTDKT